MENKWYYSKFHIPGLLAFGCAIGKKSMHCLEIDYQSTALAHKFEKKSGRKNLSNKGYVPEKLDQSGFYRMVLNMENMKYIFARINLLS